jgi:hypothetical protein
MITVRIRQKMPRFIEEYFKPNPFTLVAAAADDGTGVKYEGIGKQYDVVIFFVEREEDGKETGIVLGMNNAFCTRYFTALRFDDAIRSAVERIIHNIDLWIDKICQLSDYHETVSVYPIWYIPMVEEMIKRGLVINSGLSTSSQIHTIKHQRFKSIKIECLMSPNVYRIILVDVNFH